MGQRMARVSELVKREISEILHTRYQSESVYITVTGVTVSADLRNARVRQIPRAMDAPLLF